MLSYLQKFNNLDQDLREKISSPEVMAVINILEEKYGVSLATPIMRIMIKEIKVDDLVSYFSFEYELDKEKSKELVEELKVGIFRNVADYLGLNKPDSIPTSADDNHDKTSDIITKEENNSVGVKENLNSPAEPAKDNFFFSSEDEEEVKKLAKKVATFIKPSTTIKSDDKQNIINNQAGDIIEKVGLNFASKELRVRTEQILNTYLRGIRNKIEVKESLRKPVEFGGVNIGDQEVDNLIDLADKNKDSIRANSIELKSQPKIILPEDNLKEINSKEEQTPKNTDDLPKKKKSNFNYARDIDYDFNALNKVPAKSIEKDYSSEKKIMPDKKYQKKDKIINLKNDNLIKKDEKEKNISKPRIFKTVKNRLSVRGDKTKIEDIKYKPKLLGPIDELREMDLINFRRLGDTPKDIIAKIKEKISFLEEDSYAKRLAGIKAWRQSLVNKLYLRLGRESISQKKPISDIINEQKSKNEECLTEEEFGIVMELNKELRF